MRRNFTVRATDSCDILTLSMNDLEKMMMEFPDVYYELINDGSETLAKHE
jgi:CRP-like cAMP-binding protein